MNPATDITQLKEMLVTELQVIKEQNPEKYLELLEELNKFYKKVNESVLKA
jgi:hypothetical protein